MQKNSNSIHFNQSVILSLECPDNLQDSREQIII